MPEAQFTVSKFENRNGVTSWRVSGWLSGVRIRKNFPTREEAAAEKGALDAKAAQHAAGIRSTTTFLSTDQLREAEAAFQKLKTAPRGLLFYLDYALANYREPEREMALADAVTDYLTTKRLENRLAKQRAAHAGVFVWPADPAAASALLDSVPVSDVWGIGRRLAERLAPLGVTTARALRDLDDSLGKTFTALAVVKYYELRNKSVLVLCPKKLAENWLNYRGNLITNPFVKDRFCYDVLAHTDLNRESGESLGMRLDRVNWSNYDLVVIDESHNFRNNDAYKDHETRYQKLLNRVIRQGVKTKVLMLSATPVNNRFNDLPRDHQPPCRPRRRRDPGLHRPRQDARPQRDHFPRHRHRHPFAVVFLPAPRRPRPRPCRLQASQRGRRRDMGRRGGV